MQKDILFLQRTCYSLISLNCNVNFREERALDIFGLEEILPDNQEMLSMWSTKSFLVNQILVFKGKKKNLLILFQNYVSESSYDQYLVDKE